MAVAKKILVVDDNTDAADMTAYFLQMHGLNVQVAYGGPEALNIARTEHPTLIFLDIGMPIMDGCEVAKAVRADVSLYDIRLVALTAWGDEASRARVRDAGFDNHVVKPAKLEELMSIVENYLNISVNSR